MCAATVCSYIQFCLSPFVPLERCVIPKILSWNGPRLQFVIQNAFFGPCNDRLVKLMLCHRFRKTLSLEWVIINSTF